ncbi:putative aarF domain-containing protein kinase 2 [Fundulus diaphanus]
MVAFGARGIVANLRCALHRSGSFARRGLLQGREPRWDKRGQIFSHMPKVTLLCWGVVGASSFAASCQEAAARTTDRKSLAKVQVHKVIFFLRLGLRALVLLFKFGPLLLLSPLALMSTRCASYWLEALLWVTESSGPTFIKLGQWASTRRDIFSREFCERFSRLHVRVRPHSWAHTKQFLRRAFGEAWRRVLVFDSKEPVGSGCVAQVYRGWARVEQVEDASQSIVEEMEREDMLEAWEIPGLGGLAGVLRQLWKGRKEEDEGYKERSPADRQPGESSGEKERLIPVAIKVVHPGVRRQVEIDLLLMKAGSWLLHCLPGLKWLSMCEVVEEFEKLMTKQIDLRFEARNIERFQENFCDVDNIKFPTPLRPFVTRNTLVETFEESEPISNYLSSEIPQEVKQRIARMGVDTLLKMVFVDNVVHGDLHPGNILVQRKLYLDERTFLEFSCVVLQGERVAELILNHARANECKDVALFKKEMADLVDHAVSNTLSLGKVLLAFCLTCFVSE